VGVTDGLKATPGTIRGDFSSNQQMNLVHASDSPESAATELSIWFAADELTTYGREIDRWVLGPSD